MSYGRNRYKRDRTIKHALRHHRLALLSPTPRPPERPMHPFTPAASTQRRLYGAWAGERGPFGHSLYSLGCVGEGVGYTSEHGQRGSSFFIPPRGRTSTSLRAFSVF